jgi:hypothetical protein
MSLAMPSAVVGLEWSEWLAVGLHGVHRWRLPVLLVGILFAHGRRTVTTWLRAVGISDDFDDYYYFLASVGRKSESVATQLLVLVLRELPVARAAAGCDRRLAHQVLLSEGRGRRNPSQPNARSGGLGIRIRPHLGHDFAGRAASAVGRVGIASAIDAVRPPETTMSQCTPCPRLPGKAESLPSDSAGRHQNRFWCELMRTVPTRDTMARN